MSIKAATLLSGVTALVAALLGGAAPPAPRTNSTSTVPPSRRIGQGTLFALDAKGAPAGECPLKNTQVKGEISGFLARVTVTQEFRNDAKDKIEAVYTFPLPENSAVDDMTMLVGTRTVKGVIKRREEARAIYEAARDAGKVAGLLDQERPNIFTQSVANIMPGATVRITISYVERLKYEDGNYEFVFPMVVGPRYIPGNPTGRQGGGWAPDTDRVSDASRITPPVAPPGTRAGHDISLELSIDAGVPIDGLVSPSHPVDIARGTTHTASVKLRDQATLPNKDFILRYDVAGRKIEDAILTHHDSRGGFFTLILQPPERVRVEDVTPKEIVFVLDTSGSMSGFPIEKAKESMKLALDGLYPQDTFNLITFSGDEHVLFPQPVPATRENLRLAQEFLAGRRGGGGTEMMKAIRAALDPSDKQDHIRIACFMTDGYVGNDNEIIAEVQKHPKARVFSFGIGSSVNRYLLSKMAEAGRGEAEFVGLNDDGSAAARRFHERIRNPLLTDIQVEWNGLPVAEVYPQRVPDLFSAKPVVLSGRYMRAAQGNARLRGKLNGKDFVRDIPVTFGTNIPQRDVLATLWARTKIDALTMSDPNASATNSRDQITLLGLDYRLMTQYTSFVAVEETVVTDGGKPRTVQVPVEIPEGVSYEGVFGEPGNGPMARGVMGQSIASPMPASPSLAKRAGGFFGGVTASAPPPPPPPPRMAEAEPRRDAARPAQPVSKLHPLVAALAARARAGQGPATAEQSRLMKNGKAEVQVWLLDTSPAALARLKAAGLEIIAQPAGARTVLGRIDPAKLEALAALDVVRYLAPAP